MINFEMERIGTIMEINMNAKKLPSDAVTRQLSNHDSERLYVVPLRGEDRVLRKE